jgi:hypothetical protein
MELVKPQIQLLNSLAEGQTTKELERMRKFWNELDRRAHVALYGSVSPTEAQKATTRQSQKHQTIEPLSTPVAQTDSYATNSQSEMSSMTFVC